MMNDSWGKVHFTLTFILLNCVFYPMHILGMQGFPRRLADPYHYDTFRNLLPLNEFISWCCLHLGRHADHLRDQLFRQHVLRAACGRNPWHSNGLEWQAPSPPGTATLISSRSSTAALRVRLAGSGRRLLPTNPTASEGGMTNVEFRIHVLVAHDSFVIRMTPGFYDTQATTRSPWPHAWAWLLACATFPLIWIGGFVTTTDAGMAFRDWLTSDGHFMLAYPWLSSVGDKFVEHGHRLLGAAAGFLSIALAVVVWRCESRAGFEV